MVSRPSETKWSCTNCRRGVVLLAKYGGSIACTHSRHTPARTESVRLLRSRRASVTPIAVCEKRCRIPVSDDTEGAPGHSLQSPPSDGACWAPRTNAALTAKQPRIGPQAAARECVRSRTAKGVRPIPEARSRRKRRPLSRFRRLHRTGHPLGTASNPLR